MLKLKHLLLSASKCRSRTSACRSHFILLFLGFLQYSSESMFSYLLSCMQIAAQPLPLLLRQHFVHVFSICIALRSSTSSESKTGDLVLSTSILQLAEISEHERDVLIKKNMVCMFA